MSQLRLPPTTDSVPVARRHAREQLRDSGADVDTVVLLVSEVVTNAVLHARSDVILTVSELHIALPSVLAELRARNLHLTNLSTHHATLEDVFVTLTGRALRE